MTQFVAGETFVFLTYSEPNDNYYLLAVNLESNGQFKQVDTYQFKKGQIVHGFELIDMSQMKVTGRRPVQAETLVLAYYNGSKLHEFTFMLDKTRETRKHRKLNHSLNFRLKIAQAVPIRTKLGTSTYLVREQES